MKLFQVLEATGDNTTQSKNQPTEVGKAADNAQQLKLGTFGALIPSEKVKQKLLFFMKDNSVPNPVDVDELHCTLVQSTKFLPNYDAEGSLPVPIYGNKLRCAVWTKKDPEADGGKRNILVVTFNAPEILRRRDRIIKANEKSFVDAEKKNDYVPHVTLSYDLEDTELDADLLTYNLAKYIEMFVFDNEYEQPLDLDRTPSNSVRQ